MSIGRSNPDSKAIERFNSVTKQGKDMGHYQRLLSVAISDITGKAEKELKLFFSRSAVSKDSFKGINDFEVIAFLAILDQVISNGAA